MGRAGSGHVSSGGHQAVPIDCRTALCDVFTLCLDLLTGIVPSSMLGASHRQLDVGEISAMIQPWAAVGFFL